MTSLAPLPKETYYAKQLGEAFKANHSNVIDVHKISYWQEQLKKEHWKQFQQEQSKAEFDHLDKEVYNLFEKVLDDAFKGLKK